MLSVLSYFTAKEKTNFLEMQLVEFSLFIK